MLCGPWTQVEDENRQDLGMGAGTDKGEGLRMQELAWLYQIISLMKTT